MTYASDQKIHEQDLPTRTRRILGMRETVLTQWENEVRDKVRGADALLTPILINTLPVFFDNLAEALTPGYPRDDAASSTNSPAVHGNERARMTSYGPEQVIQEYQIFRDCFSDAAIEAGVPLRRQDWKIINASVDLGIRESIQEFTAIHESFQRRIAAGLSHDMRNPLSVMLNSAQLLQRRPQQVDVPTLASKILEHGKRLDEMIEELLDTLSYHRGQKLPLTLQRFDILPLAHKVADSVNAGHPGKCEVTGSSVTGWWCENSLRRAMDNLVGNALKYGDNGPIHIHVDTLRERMKLSVHNTGDGIAPDQTERIFDYLRRENSGSAPGWGIGLPFVQNVAESHGGSALVDSSPERGTTFTIDLPIDCRPFVTPDA